MFTLKLFTHARDDSRRIITRFLEVERIDAVQIGRHTLEIRAYKVADHDYPYKGFYVGKREPEMTAITDDNHWEWGLLENAAGKTTQHFRPYTYDTTGLTPESR